MTDTQVAEYKEVFMLFDKDEDGVLTFPELNVVMKSLGQRPSGAYDEYSMTKVAKQHSGDNILFIITSISVHFYFIFLILKNLEISKFYLSQ